MDQQQCLAGAASDVLVSIEQTLQVLRQSLENAKKTRHTLSECEQRIVEANSEAQKTIELALAYLARADTANHRGGRPKDAHVHDPRSPRALPRPQPFPHPQRSLTHATE